MLLLKKRHSIQHSGCFLLGLAAFVGLGLLVWLLAWANRGFDVTDEASYVLFIKDPQSVDSAASLFGFFLYPLYWGVNGSIAATRIVGILVLAVSGFGVAWSYLRAGGPTARTGLPLVVCISLVAATATLTYYFWWLVTPSYNWMNVLAGYLLSISLILLQDKRHRNLSAGFAGWAGVIDFIAKPPSAVAFAIIYALGILITEASAREACRQLGRAILATVGAVCVSLLLFVHPKEAMNAYGGFWELFGNGAPVSSGSWAYVYEFFSTRLGLLYLFSILLSLFGSLTCRLPVWLAGAICAVNVALLAWWLAAANGDTIPIINIGTAVVALSLIALAGSCDRGGEGWRYFLMLTMMAIVPWATAIGTGNDLIRHQAFSIGIPAVTALLAAASVPRGELLAGATSLAVVCLTVWALAFGYERPYRLSAPLWKQDQPIEMGGNGQILKVDSLTKEFVDGLRRIADSRGFRSGTPLLDLTGFNPGIAVILDARTPALPWIMGSYSYSAELLRFVLKRMTADERKSAWLVHSDSQFAFKVDALNEMGIDISRDYILIGEVFHPVDKLWIRLYAPKN